MRKRKQSTEEISKGIILNLATFAPMFVALLPLVLNVTPSIRLSLAAFIAGFTGVIVVARKEIPTAFGSITRTRAIVEGVILVILFWSSSVYIAIYGL